ncbi:MAG: hypothetical protein ACRCV0_01495, partial [Brevinema sp.]
LNSDDPNKRGIIYRVNILIKIVKIFKVFFVFKKNNKERNDRFKILYLFFFQALPEIGQFFLPKLIRNVLFRIKKFHRCLCTNTEIINSLFDIDSIHTLSLKYIVSSKQQMIVYSNPEFWDIRSDHILFIDQNYLLLGVSAEQHVDIVMKCLEVFGLVSNIIIKPNWKIASQITDYYQKIITEKNYKIHIVSSEVLAEVIVETKKTRKIVSLCGFSYIYNKLSHPEIRDHCFHRTYEEKAKEIGVNKEVLKKIKQFHDFFDKVNPLFIETKGVSYHENINDSFFNFNKIS